MVKPEDEITLITAAGIALRTAVENVRVAGRSTLGVHVIALDEGDRLASLARLEANPEENARAVAAATANLEVAVEPEEEEDVADDVIDADDVVDEMEDSEEATVEAVD